MFWFTTEVSMFFFFFNKNTAYFSKKKEKTFIYIMAYNYGNMTYHKPSDVGH